MVFQWSLVGVLPQRPWCNSPFLSPIRGPAHLPLHSPEVTGFLLLLFLLFIIAFIKNVFVKFNLICILAHLSDFHSILDFLFFLFSRSLIPFSEDFLSAHLKFISLVSVVTFISGKLDESMKLPCFISNPKST